MGPGGAAAVPASSFHRLTAAGAVREKPRGECKQSRCCCSALLLFLNPPTTERGNILSTFLFITEQLTIKKKVLATAYSDRIVMRQGRCGMFIYSHLNSLIAEFILRCKKKT